MDQKLLVVAAVPFFRSDPHYHKLLSQKNLFPFGSTLGFVGTETEVQVKFRNRDGVLIVAEDTKIENIKGTLCLKMATDKAEAAVARLDSSEYVFAVFEGSSERTTATLCFAGQESAPFETMEGENPTLRFGAFDLPPSKVTVVDAPLVRAAIYAFLAGSDPQLFSVGAQRFLSTPHILTHLFSHVMSLESADHIAYISTLKVIADQLRSLLAPRIRKVQRNHHELWSTFYGERISFLDGGVSRIVSLPGTEPMGIRVGMYTVIPGERNPEERESWQLHSYVVGDVVNDKSLITELDYRTDTKRLQEAARYILESLSALRHLAEAGERPRLLLLHGPLQNAFEEYDEAHPSFIPGVSKAFLESVGIRREEVVGAVANIPSDDHGQPLWNACIPIYLFIMKRLREMSVPVAGVVERGRGISFAMAAIDSLVGDGVLPRSTRSKLLKRLLRYEISDELLFGCILEEGEYLEPLRLVKNVPRRAHDRWQPVVAQFVAPIATMIKCSATNFPYRVEMAVAPDTEELDRLMSLLYHMSLLLPNYSFPVGIDIADKYAKIPDWLSKGLSARLTANVLRKVLETGDAKLLMKVRRLLALSPRDFFFRPKA